MHPADASDAERPARAALLGLAIVVAGDGGFAIVEGGRALARAPSLDAAERRRLDLLTARHGDGGVAVALPTLGGMQLWADVVASCGWRIQEHLPSGRHRLLDPALRRRARGGFAACRVALERERLARGLRPRSPHLVVLLPGLFRSPHALRRMERALADAGFETANCSYASTRSGIARHGERLRRLLAACEGISRVSFVTHSLGGLVARQALAGAPPALAVDRLVMLFPPSRGSQLADRLHRRWWYRLLLGPAGQELTSAGAARIPAPTCPFAIIAGGRGDGRGRNPCIVGDDDGTVAVDEAWLPGARRFTVLDVGHTLGIRDPRVIAEVLAALGPCATGPAQEPQAQGPQAAPAAWSSPG